MDPASLYLLDKACWVHHTLGSLDGLVRYNAYAVRSQRLVKPSTDAMIGLMGNAFAFSVFYLMLINNSSKFINSDNIYL